jgi:hypothetical protein
MKRRQDHTKLEQKEGFHSMENIHNDPKEKGSEGGFGEKPRRLYNYININTPYFT